MEDTDLAAKYAQIQLGHSFAAVSLAIFNQDLTALVKHWIHIKFMLPTFGTLPSTPSPLNVI